MHSLVTGVGRVGCMDQGKELYLGSAGFWKGPD